MPSEQPVVRADIAQLHIAGGDVQRHGEALIGVHHASYSDSANAQGGWVGSSSGALTGMLDDWSTVAVNHTGQFVHHVDTLHTSASTFAEAVRNHADALAAVTPAAERPASQPGPQSPRDL